MKTWPLFLLLFWGCIPREESRPLRFNGGRLQHYCQGYEQIAIAPFVVNYTPMPDGSAAYPYLICYKAQMDGIALNNTLWNKHFILMQDIDMSNGGANNGIIGTLAVNFTGVFDGVNYSVRNFRHVDNTNDYIGLFGYVGAAGVVRKLSATNVTVDGQDFVGGLIGYNSGTVSNVFSSGTVSGTAMDSDDVGGLIGYNDGAVTAANSSAVVSASDDNIGGLIGENLAPLSLSFATGSVTGNAAGQSAVGGLIGNNNTNGDITNCYATGAVSGTDAVGGLIGDNGSTSDILTSYASGNVTGTGTATGGLLGTNANSNVTSSYASGIILGATNVGGLVGSQTTAPTLSLSYATGTVTGTDGVGGLVGRLGAGTAAVVNNCYATGAVTNTAGDDTGGLVGYNDGGIINGGSRAGGAVSGFDDHVGGLVGTNTGTINGTSYASGPVTVTDVTNPARVGGLVGYNNGGTIAAAYSSSVVTGAVASEVGGLVGENAGALGTSYATGVVSGSGNNLGGLIGLNNAIALASVYASVPVTGSATASHVGGLIGYNQGAGSTVTNSYAIGSVICTQDDCGALIGLNEAAITTSYARGNVSGTGGSRYGGLVGSSTATITSSYALGEISGATQVGGLVGLTTANITSSQAYGAVYGSVTQTGGLVGYLNSSAVLTSSWALAPVTGVTKVGGLVGETDNGTIQTSYAMGNVFGSGLYVGGLVGDYVNGTTGSILNSWSSGNILSTGGTSGGLVGRLAGDVTKSYATGNTVETGAVAGGLVGQQVSGTILSSYARGNVTVTGTDGGGLVGQAAAAISESYAAGIVVAGANGGGFVGNDVGGTTYTENFWEFTLNATLADVGNNGNVADITAESTLNLQTTATYPAGWDFATDWVMFKGVDGFDYPRLRDLYFCHGANLTDAPYANSAATPAGTRADPIKICTGTQLQALGGVSADWGKYFVLGENIDLGAYVGTTFQMIGTTATAFSGTFEGRGYEVSGFTYSSAVAQDVGIFGYVNGDGVLTGVGDGHLFGLRVKGSNVTGGTNVGTLVGRLGTGAVFDVVVDNGSVEGATDVGGLMGKNSGDVRFISVSANVDGTTAFTGGVIGENSASGSLQFAQFSAALDGVNVSGGVVGLNSGLISNSYSNAVNISGTTSTAGAVGSSSGTLQYLYSGSTNPGLIQVNTGAITQCFYDDTLKTSASVGGSALTTAQMQVPGNFLTWDFNLHWIVTGANYPVLKWE